MSQRNNKVGRFEATILFCDIRGFTALFDQRDPLEALAFANSVLGELGGVVEACSGTLDKFTGDGFLAHFGIVGPPIKHAIEACWCVVRMRLALNKINSSRYVANQPVINIGVGIHSGVVAAGTISAMQKSEYTVLGSAVNLAARIEGLTKSFGVDCLLSEQTVSQIGDQLMLQKMPAQRIRGVSEPVGVSWLLPLNSWTE